MSGSFRIQDSSTKETASVLAKDMAPRGLMTYTHPYDRYDYGVSFLTNSEFGRDINQDPTSLVVTATNIHDGTDNAGWTASNISGSGFVFNSTAQVYSGTQSIDATASTNNNIASFAAPSPINPASVSFIQLRIYISAWSNRGTKQVLLFLANDNVVVSTQIDLANYVDVTLFNTWQLADIPISDFGVTSVEIDELRIETIDQGPGAAPDYYIDELQYLTSVTSGAYEYIYAPKYDEIVNVTSLRLTGRSTGSANVNTTEFFGVSTLANGIELVLRDDNRVYFALDARDLFGLLSWGDVHVETVGGGTEVTTIVDFNIPQDHMRVIGKKGMFIVLRIRDNLSGISKLNASVTYSNWDLTEEEI